MSTQFTGSCWFPTNIFTINIKSSAVGIFPSLIVGAFICIANEVLWIREGEGEQKDYILGDRKITFLKKERLHFLETEIFHFWRQKDYTVGDR